MAKKSNKIYIGLNASYHDPSIALVDEDGFIIYAQATERHSQNKRSLFTVADNFYFVEKIIDSNNIDDYEIGTNWEEHSSFFKKIYFLLLTLDSSSNSGIFNFLAEKVSGIKQSKLIHLFFFTRIANFSLRSFSGHTFRYLLNKKNGIRQKKINLNNHHLCHAYHAHFTSSFTSSIILIIDGSGDNGHSISIFQAENQNIKLVNKGFKDFSLGSFYSSLTDFCGLSIFSGEEWKVMGMAPYGTLNKELYEDFKNWITVDGIYIKSNGRKHVYIEEKIKNNQYKNITIKDIAYTGQLFFEELVIKFVNELYKKHPHQNLIIAGGCALNSACIGKLHIFTPYKHIFVPSAPADDGGAVGAALLLFKKYNPLKNIPNKQANPYLGNEINEKELEHIIKFSGYKHVKLEYPQLYKVIAKELADGKIIGWVQGKAEFGPRSLGNRSILANPSLKGMKDKINATVKFREEYRPFAPSILEEYANDYFENYYPTPYMERVLTIKEDKREQLNAVNHIDNTGRLQTVSKENNEHFYNLISEFNALTNIPVLLNTSFNVMGKPIVDSVADMVAVFVTSGLDAMVINDYVFYK
ncbi:MAG: carbamoyltransferase [Burkholderiales bacterium]|nr:carbamoyltransferase [Bacteroidia bacterium]